MEYTSIIKTDIVDRNYDMLWDDITDIIAGATPKPILILVNEVEKGSVEDTQLQKMLDASKLTTEQYHIIRLRAGQKIAWHQLKERLDPRIVFLIGVMPLQLGVSAYFKLNEANNFSDCVWLPTLDISELEKHQEVKKQLWLSGMRPLFVDNPLPTKES